MLDLLTNHMVELIVGGISSLAIALWGYIGIVLKRNDAKLHEFAALPKTLATVHAALEVAQNSMTSLKATLTDVHLELRARGDLNIDAAEFSCDHDGSVTNVNQTFARWLGVGKMELLGWGWINYVHIDDREHIRHEWQACIKEHRVFNVRYRLVEADGDITHVHTVATPIPDAPPARQWVGVIRRELK